MTSHRFLELTSQPRCGDGAMYTELITKGVNSHSFPMSWLLNNPTAVAQVHQSYVDAGATVITTHSFSGSYQALAQHHYQDQTFDLNRIAAITARAIASPSRFVLGNIGPCHDPKLHLTQSNQLSPQPYVPQIQGLFAGGIDALLCETLTHPNELDLILQANRELPSPLPVIACFVMKKSSDGAYTNLLDTPFLTCLDAALNLGVDGIGINCGVNLDYADYLIMAKQLVEHAGTCPVMIKPNGNRVTTSPINDRLEFAILGRNLFEAGVKIVGGCCNSTPLHIKKIARILSERSA